MMKATRQSLAVLATAATLILSGCHDRPTITKSHAVASEARHAIEPSAVSAPGTVEPWAGEVKLATIEPGQLVELLIAEGQRVQKGELLARLEDSQQRSAMAIAEADLRQARALEDGTSSTSEELRAAEAGLVAAAARADQQRREGERAVALGSFGALPGAEVERTLAPTRVEEAARDAADARLAAVKRGARWSERRLARARRESAEARLADARAALARREVRATIDAEVLWSRYHVGEFYTQSQGPLLILGDGRHLQVRLEVDDGDALLVAVDARVQLRTDGGDLLGGGTVVRIAAVYGSRSLANERPTARTDARVREVFVEVDAATSLTSGQRVWAHIQRSALHATR